MTVNVSQGVFGKKSCVAAWICNNSLWVEAFCVMSDPEGASHPHSEGSLEYFFVLRSSGSVFLVRIGA